MNPENAMTGKDLKVFAATLPDEAIVETEGSYRTSWGPLDKTQIRAIITGEMVLVDHPKADSVSDHPLDKTVRQAHNLKIAGSRPAPATNFA